MGVRWSPGGTRWVLVERWRGAGEAREGGGGEAFKKKVKSLSRRRDVDAGKAGLNKDGVGW